MTDTISVVHYPSDVEIDFSWSPAGTYTFTSPGGVVISAPSASVSTALTFTATARINRQGNDITGPLSIIEYRWDFGDGIFSYGATAPHTYRIANFQASTKLRVTDSQGRQWFTRRQMYLS